MLDDVDENILIITSISPYVAPTPTELCKISWAFLFFINITLDSKSANKGINPINNTPRCILTLPEFIIVDAFKFIVPKFIPSIICSGFIKFINSPRLKLINNFNPKEIKNNIATEVTDVNNIGFISPLKAFIIFPFFEVSTSSKDFPQDLQYRPSLFSVSQWPHTDFCFNVILSLKISCAFFPSSVE